MGRFPGVPPADLHLISRCCPGVSDPPSHTLAACTEETHRRAHPRRRGRAGHQPGGDRPAARRGVRRRAGPRRPRRGRRVRGARGPTSSCSTSCFPGFDGLEVCRRIQASRPVPVLMLTARADETDLLVGLAVGADDYVTKPFSMREVVARIRALLRRVERAAALAASGAAPHRGARAGDRPSTTPAAGSRCAAPSAPDPARVRPAVRAGHRAGRRSQPGRAHAGGVGVG